MQLDSVRLEYRGRGARLHRPAVLIPFLSCCLHPVSRSVWLFFACDAAYKLVITRMALLRNALYFAGVLLPLALADVDFTEPAAGDVITGTSLVATWLESGQKPSISTFDSYSLFLCAGGNNESDFVRRFS
jgi:hypothetical protein